LDELLREVQAHGYETLFTQRTLAGPPDPRRLVPLLVLGRSMEAHASFANDLLQQLGLEKLQFHPGYQLRVQTLGAFQVWLGDQEFSAGDWQREKARQLFQLLVTSRRIMLDRDVICDQLWPDLLPDAAQRGFKVALNALYKAIEPRRESGAPSAYVSRDGSLYRLRPEADLWLDAEEFERAVAAGDALLSEDRRMAFAAYQRALALYQGDFLEEYIYEDWCTEERERLRALYLRTADRLARALLEDRAWDEAIEVCQSIIVRDDCWENAYRLMMVAHARLGNRAQALRVYQNLKEHLHTELGVDPAPETEALSHLIAHSSLPDLGS
jgi:DNA-binding SARP family transcriptional activator